MRTDSGTDEDNIYVPYSFHVNTLQIWKLSDHGWAFACTISSHEHSANLAVGLDMCNGNITGFQCASGSVTYNDNNN